MQRIEIAKPGPPEVLRLMEAPTPEPGPGEVLIKVAASGVNRADIAQRMGFYPPPAGASEIPGLEVSGEIIKVGEGVKHWRPGDAVCALLSGGGYADHAVAAAGECLPLPDNLTMLEGASLVETLMTVWSNVIDRAHWQPGESFLVHGGSSGIGTTAIQLIKLMGGTVYTTAGSDEKVAFCRKLGADVAINYKEQDFVEVLREETNGNGVDVILDMVGGDYVERHIELAATDGRIVNIAFLGGARAEVNMMPIMRKRLTLTGSTLRPRSTEFKSRLADAVRKKVWPWIKTGSFKPIIHCALPAAEVAEAHRIMEASEHIGKIVLTWD